MNPIYFFNRIELDTVEEENCYFYFAKEDICLQYLHILNDRVKKLFVVKVAFVLLAIYTFFFLHPLLSRFQSFFLTYSVAFVNRLALLPALCKLPIPIIAFFHSNTSKFFEIVSHCVYCSLSGFKQLLAVFICSTGNKSISCSKLCFFNCLTF